MDYECLREQYPGTISMDQLYRICHISKRKARWLLENGIIPCEDSGKKTRRFRIRLEDVIVFLKQQDSGEIVYQAPLNAFSSRHKNAENHMRAYLDADALCSMILDEWSDAPDVLTAKQAASLCGYCPTSLNRWMNAGKIEGILYRNTNLISRKSLAEFLASHAGQDIGRKAELHEKLLGQFQAKTQNSAMEFGSMAL